MYHRLMTLQEINHFLSSAGLSDRCSEAYNTYLLWFFAWLSEAYPEKSARDADASTVIEWFATRPKWSSSTRHYAAAALRGFYRFTYGADHPVTRIKVKRIEAAPQRTLDQEELTTLLLAIDTTTPRGIRDLAIVTLMADTGMRSGEVCGLELKNLDIKKGRLVALTKGGIWSEKVFAEYTASCVESWLSIRSNYAMRGVKTVFVGVGGRTPGQPMTQSGMRFVYETLSEKAGLPHISPHAMRRTFATLATEQGAPTRLVQVAGGWKSIRMVEHYTRRLRPDTIRKYSPVNSAVGIEIEH